LNVSLDPLAWIRIHKSSVDRLRGNEHEQRRPILNTHDGIDELPAGEEVVTELRDLPFGLGPNG
jgi:hypothetical protein